MSLQVGSDQVIGSPPEEKEGAEEKGSGEAVVEPTEAVSA